MYDLADKIEKRANELGISTRIGERCFKDKEGHFYRAQLAGSRWRIRTDSMNSGWMVGTYPNLALAERELENLAEMCGWEDVSYEGIVL